MSSIKDVAKRAGVSAATVSRVVNGNYDVTEKTREKVIQAIEQLNYTPNVLARSLKSETTQSIGFLVSDISNDYFIKMAKVIEDVLSMRNYNIIVCSTENKKERELSYLQMLVGKQMDAILLNTTGLNNEYVSAISKSMPLVLLERRIDDAEFRGDFVTYDEMDSVRQLVQQVIAHGHQRIGVINGPIHLSSARARQQAADQLLAQYSLEQPLALHRYDADFSQEGGYSAARWMMDQPQRPTALIVMNNMMAVGALSYLRNHGIDVPGDVSVVNIGEIANSDILYVNPTCTTRDPVPLGAKAVELVFTRIAGVAQSNREVLFMPQLRMGGTLGLAPATK